MKPAPAHPAGVAPGTAKTLAVRTFATVVGGSFARIQFTPDLVPSDIVGTRVYQVASRERFDIELGPVFTNFVLADEVNRAPAKVQSAMLELMAEKQVSIAGTTFAMKKPFIVIATQNPIESEGRLPAARGAARDRFLLKVDVPSQGQREFEILRRMSVTPPTPQPVLNPELTLQLQDMASHVFVHNLVAARGDSFPWQICAQSGWPGRQCHLLGSAMAECGFPGHGCGKTNPRERGPDRPVGAGFCVSRR